MVELRSWLFAIACVGACSPQLVDAVEGAGGTGASSSAGTGGTGQGGGGASSTSSTSGGGGSLAEGGAAGDGAAGETAVLRGDALLHRYSFDGVGTSAMDSKGGAHGSIMGTELTGTGTLVLAGLGSDQYVDLPDGLISGLGDATFETWVTWDGGNVWQRIFDFGSNFAAPSDGRLSGGTYLFLTPEGLEEGGVMRAVFSLGGAGEAEVIIDGTSPLATGEISHVALVFDDLNDLMTLYRNGVFEGEVPVFDKLSGINDVNNWFGQSQFETDAEFGGTIHEFRIYDAALSAEEIEVSYAAGPQAVFPTP